MNIARPIEDLPHFWPRLLTARRAAFREMGYFVDTAKLRERVEILMIRHCHRDDFVLDDRNLEELRRYATATVVCRKRRGEEA